MRRIRIEWVERIRGMSGLYGQDGGWPVARVGGVLRMTFFLYRDNIHDPAVRKDLAQEIRRWVRGPMWQKEQAEIAAEKASPSWYQI